MFSLHAQTTQIQQDLCSAFSDYFSLEDDFSCIGEIDAGEDSYEIFQNRHLFENNRMSWKLIILKNKELQGFYSGIQATPVIEETSLVFPFEEKYGDRINLESGIPEKVYLDGESVLFEKAQYAGNEGFVPEAGFVPDEETAIAIAIAVWKPVYGSKIKSARHYEATLENGIWCVSKKDSFSFFPLFN